MCNIYQISTKKGTSQGVRGKVAAVIGNLPSSLVRKSDPGIVMRADGQVQIMRWGFHRSFNPAINNARSDKLEAGMWAEAFRDRRCIIPMTAFYEWGPGSGGHKQAYEFRDPEDDFLWAAGLWEPGGEHGPCYTMVTTEASPLMAPIHDRMPALLRPDAMQEFLAGGHWSFQAFTGPITAAHCESPLMKRRDDGWQQSELF